MSDTRWENWETVEKRSSTGLFEKFNNVVAAIVCRDGKLYFTPALVRLLNSPKGVMIKSNGQQFAIVPATLPAEEEHGYLIFYSQKDTKAKSGRVSVTRFSASELTVGGVYVGRQDSGAAIFSKSPQQLLVFPPAHRRIREGK